MDNKILKLSIAFTVLFSLHGYSQTAKETDHPLLDKYYPRAEKDTGTKINEPAPQFSQAPAKPLPQLAPAPIPATTTAISKPTATIVSQPETKLVPQIIPDASTSDTTAVSPPPAIAVLPPETQVVSGSIPLADAKDATIANKPISAVVAVPVVQQKPAIKPVVSPPMDMRLGSSTPAYDTWKKNNNGAGSVTTSYK